MIDEGFFLTVAGIAMSFAGFAGLMNAFRGSREEWAAMELFQLRLVVAYGITTLFGSLLAIPFTELFGQHDGIQWLAVVMVIASSGLVIGSVVSDFRHGHGHGTALPTRVRGIFTTIAILGVLALVGTVLTGAPALYRIALLLMLAMPAGTFVYVVVRIER